MKFRMLTVVTALLFMILSLGSCGDDDDQDDPGEIDLTSFVVNNIGVTDLSDNGNASDIGIVFNSPKPSIDLFKIFVVPAVNYTNFSLAAAEALSESSFQTIANDETKFSIQLEEDLLDTDGNAISEGTAYRITILSETTDGSILSAFSDEFTLKPFEKGVFTIQASFEQTDGLDGIALDAGGNVYVSNFGVFVNGAGSGAEVYQINRFAQRSVFANGLNVPGGCVVGPNGNLYVNNGGNIHEIQPSGTKNVFATSSDGFAGLVFDENGNIYSGGFSHSLILKIDSDGNVTTLADDARLTGTVGIAYHQESATLYAGNFNSGDIYAITMSGEVSLLATIGGIGYLTEMNGFLYATEFSANKIAKISLDGEVERIAGTGAESQTDGELLDATFFQPNGIVGDAANNVLYVSDWGAPRITKIQL